MSSASSSHRSSRLSSTAAEARFHGVLTVSKNRVIRRLNFNFFSYLFLLSPSNSYFLFFIEGWRYLQWCLPCLIPGNRALYPEGSSSDTYTGVLSIVNRLVPSFVRSQFYVVFASIYIIVFILFFCLFFISLYFFSKNSMIPRQLSWFIVYFFESAWVILQPIILAVTGDQFGYEFIENKNTKNAGVWVCFFFVVAIYCMVGFCHEAYVSVSLSFRPSSIPSFNHHLEIILLHMTSFVSFITAILPYCPRAAKIVLYILTILTYTSPFVFVPMCGHFIKYRHGATFYALSCSALLTTILNMVFDILGRDVNSIMMLAEYVILVIFLLIFFIVTKRQLLKSQLVLDRIADQPETFDSEIGNVFISLVFSGAGFSNAHPLVSSWKFMRMMTERWPYVSTTWMQWARFVSCFPDENRLLLWIDDQIQKFVFHTESVQHFRAQIHYIVQRREASMTSQLKRKIADCHRLTIGCRARMRAYWESVMQGNAFDMEATALAAQNANDEAESTIQHFLSMYPNNQYVTHSYLRFLTGIKADPIEVKKWTQNYSNLKSGQKVTPDIPQQQGIAFFPNLLSIAVVKQSAGMQTALITDVVTSQSLQSSRMPPTSPNSARNGKDDDGDGANPLLSSVRVSIYGLSIPAVKHATITLTVFFLLFFAVVFPVGLALTQGQFTVHNEFMTITSKASAMRNDIVQISFFSIEYITQLLGIEPNKSAITNNVNDSMTPIANISDNIRKLISSIEESGNELRRLNTLQTKGKHIKAAYQILFESTNNFSSFTTTVFPGVTITNVSMSVESVAISAKLFASQLLSLTKLRDIVKYVHDEKISNLINNAFQSTEYITEACFEIDRQIKENCANLTSKVMIVGISLALIIFFMYIIAVFALAHKFNSDKRATAKCFLMIPKHIVSAVVDSFKRTSTSDFTDTVSDTGGMSESRKNRQEENFLATLSSAATNQWTVYGSVILISTYQLLVMTCAIVAAVFIYISTKDLSTFCEVHSPFHNYFLLPYTEAVLSVGALYLLAIADNHQTVPGFTRSELIRMGQVSVKNMKYFYGILLFGNESIGIENLGSLKPQYILDGFAGSLYMEDITAVTPEFHSIYEIMSPSSIFYLSNMIINRALARATLSNVSLYDEQLTNLWHMLYSHFYETYMLPISNSLPLSTIDDYNNLRRMTTMIYAVLYIVALFFSCLSMIRLANINSNIKWIIKTMLQCPPEVLVASESVMRILSGSFREVMFKVPNFSDHLYEKLTNDCDDAFLVTSTDTTIMSASNACQNFFGEPPQSLVGKAFREILVGTGINGNVNVHDQSIDEFLNKLDTAISGRRSLTFTHMIKIEDSKAEDGSNKVRYINITLTAFSKGGVVKSLIEAKGKLTMLSFVCQDMTDSVMTDLLLSKERAKADKMLKTILPPPIVSMLNKDDGEVSIVAQSASIIAVTIHDFDTTVSSISAAQTMTTLTRVYSEFDSILEKSPSMIKVKTIADLYLAVGGIFSSSNQPDIHAKECVKFGIDCVKKISEITKELGLPLRLVIGVNTGGPVIAGVLDVDRPTFNIIGTPIDVALNMMTTGEPMMIHISRYVYELIFGASFKIREGGEIELKSGNVNTYLVDPM